MSSTDQPEKMSLESMIIAEHQKAKLKELFPEVFTEGSKIDFEQLKRTLGEMVDSGKERFGMNWAGKADCFKTIQQPSVATLVPCPEESIDFDTTENVFIEGDNLEVLKLLQKSYLGKIKMIYIDPPYNTGNDFIYPDNYSENLDTYLEYTGQVDGEGRKFRNNLDTDGRFHSKWMNMMYPRLFLAKNLLREDGIIFISIDDHEIINLKNICNDVFGEENFIGCIVRTTGQTTGQDSDGLGSSFDYLLVYSKNTNRPLNGLPLSESDLKRFDNEDEKGKYAYDQLRKTGSNDRREDRPNMYYAVIDPDGNKLYPTGPNGYDSRWRVEEKTYKKLVSDNFIIWKKTTRNGGEVWWPYVKYYLEGRTKRPSPLWDDMEGNKKASRDLRSIFDGKKIFDFPKPIEMIDRIISISCAPSDIILDFFAGSATTAHAALKSSVGGIKFICVQLPEPTFEQSDEADGEITPKKGYEEALKAGFKTIAEISKERIRRAAARIKAEVEANTDLLTEEKAPLDLGFRVFKLQKSNFKVWDATLEKDATNIQLALEAHIDHIDPNATQQAILFELLLKAGFELTTPIDTLALADKTVFSIAEGALLICLEKELTLDLIRAIAGLEPSRVIVLDEGFQNNDQLKTNASLTLKAKGVVDFRTV